MSGRQSLAGAFAPVAPARGVGLQGLLPPKRGKATQTPDVTAPGEPTTEAPVREPILLASTTSPEAATEVGERDEPEPAQATKAGPRQSVKHAAPAQKASETVSGALRNVGVYLPPQLLADVKDAVHQGRTTYAELLIDALELLTNEQIAGEFTPEATLTNSGMPRRAPRKRGEAGIQIQLRLDGLQVAWLDEKVTEFNAPSRSALVSAVFKLHVNQTAAPETAD